MKKLIDPSSTLFIQYFEECDLVASTPNVFFYVGEHAVLRGTPGVVQAMPTRVYVGIKNATKEDPWYTNSVFDNGIIKKDIHREDNEDLIGKRHVLNFIQHEIPDYETEKKTEIEGLSIKVLSDIYPGSGANWSGAYSSALAACIYIGVIHKFKNEIKITPDINNFRTNFKDCKLFKDINSLSFFLETAFHGGSASGYGNFISLLGCPVPTIFQCQTRYSDMMPYINVYTDNENYLVNKEQMDVVIKRLDEIIKNTEIIELTKDIDLGYYVAVIDTEKRKEKSTSKAIKEVILELKNDVKNNIDYIKKKIIKLPYDFQENSLWSWHDYSCTTFLYFFRDYLYSNEKESFKKSIKYMNAVGHVLLSYGLGWKELEDLSSKIYLHKDIDEVNTAIKLTGGGKAGTFVLMAPYEKLNCEKLKKIIKNPELILYSSCENKPIKGLEIHKINNQFIN